MVVLFMQPVAWAQEAAPVSAPAAQTGKDLISDAEWNRSAPGVTAAPASTPNAGRSLASVGVSLLAVVALAIGLGYLAKRLGVRRLVQGRGRHLEVIESIPIAPKRSVALVRIGEHVVLVGIGEHELSTLATLPASVLAERLPPVDPNASAALPPAAPSGFQQVLSKLTGKAP